MVVGPDSEGVVSRQRQVIHPVRMPLQRVHQPAFLRPHSPQLPLHQSNCHACTRNVKQINRLALLLRGREGNTGWKGDAMQDESVSLSPLAGLSGCY